MSMFHELMMRKKEQIMYATIKGTLTENDGVFSGFSASNYLETQKNIAYNNDSWEYLFKFTTGNDVTTQQCICENYYQDNTVGYCGLTLYIQNGAMYYRLGTGNNQIVISSYGGSFSPNTTYYFSVTFNKDISKIIFKTGTSKSTMTTLREANDNILIGNMNYPMRIGRRHTQNSSDVYAFGGSIDLNESYLKLGSTKYKLQAVVGYTIVGSPTIVDGVVSGFSENDYVIINQTLPSTDVRDYEIFIKFSTTELVATSKQIFAYLTTTNSGLRLYNPTPIWTISRYVNTTTNVQMDSPKIITTNTEVLMHLLYKGNDVFSCEISIDNGVTWSSKDLTLENEIENINTARNLVFGRLTIGGALANPFINGSIYIKDCCIKCKRKLWFNGQQA